MRRASSMPALVACALGAAIVVCCGRARADSYDTIIVGPQFAFGGRAGSGTDDSILGGLGGFVGARLGVVRLGAEARAALSRSFAIAAFDGGAFLSSDFFSIWLDPQLSLGGFVRLDALVRWVPLEGAPGQVGFLPLGSIGLRLGGMELSLAAGPELGLALAPGANAVGFDGELRIGFDLVELVRLGQHFRDAKMGQPR